MNVVKRGTGGYSLVLSTSSAAARSSRWDKQKIEKNAAGNRKILRARDGDKEAGGCWDVAPVRPAVTRRSRRGSLNVRFAPKATELLRRRQLSQRANRQLNALSSIYLKAVSSLNGRLPRRQVVQEGA